MQKQIGEKIEFKKNGKELAGAFLCFYKQKGVRYLVVKADNKTYYVNPKNLINHES